MKLAASARAALALLCLAPGCTLYFGDGSDGVVTIRPDADDGAGEGSPGGWACEDDRDCAAGCYCGDDGDCIETTYCSSNADCDPGLACDLTRSSCVPPDHIPGATCGNGLLEPGEVCDDGNLAPGDGCGSTCEYEGCDALGEAACLAAAACEAVYRGQGCTRPDGQACESGDSGCTCQTFAFDACRDDAP